MEEQTSLKLTAFDRFQLLNSVLTVSLNHDKQFELVKIKEYGYQDERFLTIHDETLVSINRS
jgi:hypothetical protein